MHEDPVVRLFTAVREGDVQALRKLLAKQPALANARSKTSLWVHHDCTPLQLAVELGEQDVVAALVDSGADVNDKADLTGWAPLHLVLDNPDLARYLIERGATEDIHAAAGLGDLPVLTRLASGDPGSVRSKGPDGATPLHFAATPTVASFLLDRGADLEARDEEHNMSPLGWLASNREVAGYLRSRGATITDPFLAAALGDTRTLRRFVADDPGLIQASTPNGDWYGTGATLLHLAASSGSVEAVSYLLKNGAEVNAKGGWFDVTPLHWAAQKGFVEAVHELLAHGADLSARDSEHNGTPLDWAKFFHQQPIIDLLSELSPNP
jgi:ankyrin repeat protein